MIKLLSVAIVAALFLESHQLPLAAPRDCWTDWLNSDDPNETGDFETLDGLRQRYPGKICAKPLDIQAQTLSGQCVSKTGDEIYKMDTKVGFICRNQDQCNKGMCQDYQVRFRCPPSFCNTGCWTAWFDRDNPDGSGDWEILSQLRHENKGEICSNPTRIEVQTLSGRSVASTGDRIHRSDPQYGFACRIQDHVGRRLCQDYRVRFWCPPSFCNKECWTAWFDRDDPTGTGDWETLSYLRRENKGKICSNPTRMEVQTLSGRSVASTGDRIYRNDTQFGFACRNQDQVGRRLCQDYRVRFSCPAPFSCGIVGQVCWTKWFDHDNPSGTGDWEVLSGLQNVYRGQICAKPVSIEVVTVGTQIPAASTGQIFEFMSPEKGFACRNRSQRGRGRRMCLDYKVRFGCPC